MRWQKASNNYTEFLLFKLNLFSLGNVLVLLWYSDISMKGLYLTTLKKDWVKKEDVVENEISKGWEDKKGGGKKGLKQKSMGKMEM